eukprot:g2813.t1
MVRHCNQMDNWLFKFSWCSGDGEAEPVYVPEPVVAEPPAPDPVPVQHVAPTHAVAVHKKKFILPGKKAPLPVPTIDLPAPLP